MIIAKKKITKSSNKLNKQMILKVNLLNSRNLHIHQLNLIRRKSEKIIQVLVLMTGAQMTMVLTMVPMVVYQNIVGIVAVKTFMIQRTHLNTHLIATT